MAKNVFVLKYESNEDIKTKIEEFMNERKWNEAYISGAIGSVKELLLTAPKSNILPPIVEETVLDRPGEVTSFIGEIVKKENMDEALKNIYKDMEGEYFIHLHISVATAGGSVYGGGLKKGKTFRGMKLYIHEI